MTSFDSTTAVMTNPARTADPVISVRGLRMAYGDKEAVGGINLQVNRGDIFAFLGPNGAGKTTTVEILEGFRRRTAGDVHILGVDPNRAGGAWRARLGVVLQESHPEPELKVRECLDLYAGYYRAPRSVAETLELVSLADQSGLRCGVLSGGQRRRLDVAVALIGDPELLFLDEPTTGFDPSARRAAWEMIRNLREFGKTIFLTTHDMEEAEYLADRINIIAAGHIVAEGTPSSLGGRNTAEAVVRFSLPAGRSLEELPKCLTSIGLRLTDGRIELRATRPLPYLAALAAWAEAQGLDLPDLRVDRPTLEDVYLKLAREDGS